MDDLRRISDQLAKYPQEIYDASVKTEDLRETWMLVDARKDYETAKAFLSAKAGNITEGQAKAKAIEGVYETSMEVIKAESAYRRALADQTRIENEFTSIRKQANLLETTINNSGRV